MQETYGFGYEILTEREIDPIIAANIETLRSYYSSRVKPVPAQVVEAARKAVSEKQGLRISELLVTVAGLDMDVFYKLLVDQKLYVPLDVCQLDLPPTVQVFTDRLSFEAFGFVLPRKEFSRLRVRSRFPQFVPGERLTIRGKDFSVVAPSPTVVQFRDEQGDSTVMTREDLERLLLDKQISSLGVPENPDEEARKILLSTPPHKLAPAVERCSLLTPVIEGKVRLRSIKNKLRDAQK